MGYKYTLGKMIADKKQRYEDALNSNCYQESQMRMLADAIDSCDYITEVLSGDIALPFLSEDCNSDSGKVFGWLAGSFKNLDLADQILDGRDEQSEEIKRLRLELEKSHAEKRQLEKELNEVMHDCYNAELKLKEKEGELFDTRCELRNLKGACERFFGSFDERIKG